MLLLVQIRTVFIVIICENYTTMPNSFSDQQLKELLKRHKVNQSEYNDLFSVSSKDEFYAGGNNDNNFLEELNMCI